jgi:hypothetical protein
VPGIKTRGWIPHDSQVQGKIVQELQRDGYDVKPYVIDVADYRCYLERANYANFRDYYKGGRSPNFVEKSLEHYVQPGTCFTF